MVVCKRPRPSYRKHVRLRHYVMLDFDRLRPNLMKTPRAIAAIFCLALEIFTVRSGAAQEKKSSPQGPALELTRPVRTWEFLSAVGTRAGIFGNEAGRVEAWVYPLKIVRDFHLRFRTGERVLAADSLARTVTVRPESTTILYTGDTFSVRETFFVPVNEPGAVILFDVETEFPLEIEATFHRDFQLEWPAGLGATYSNWDRDHHAFYFGEEQKKFAAFLGSPTAEETKEEFDTNYSSERESSFRLGVTEKGRDSRLIVLAGSVQGRPEAEETYRRLTADYSKLLQLSADYYRNYLAQTVSVDLPDEELQRAYDWSRVSMLQGLVTNPYLGTGLVAGYRTSGESQRPGFAWFFGRDSMWTSLALDAAGDYATTRKALEFIGKYQREDGKIPHEIAQGANFVPWFTDYPYAYASVDATPLYIITMNDYVVESGDNAFAQAKWDSAWKAYQFMRSTYDAQGLPQNFGFGHGWVEGGPLLPIKTELYQSGLGAEALRALSNLARVAGKESESHELAAAFEKQKALVNTAFWLADKNRFAFALDKNDKQVDEASVLSTVPMWFGDLDHEKANSMITQLSDSNHQTGWGMRIISGEAERFSGGGYHYGSVWPLFTGWASVGEYRYHREHAAYANLRANALLALDGSPGHVTEVLSGDYYQGLSTSSPHQIWSAAMVVAPILRGMFGLATDAKTATLTLAPHLPADWTFFGLRDIHVGAAIISVQYIKTGDGIDLKIQNGGSQPCTVDFQPAFSLRAKILYAELNNHRVAFQASANENDQHATVRATAALGSTTIHLRVADDFGVSFSAELPQLGSASEGLRILSENWSPSKDQLTLSISGAPSHEYDLSLWNGAAISSVDGGELMDANGGAPWLYVALPEQKTVGAAHATVTIRFSPAGHRKDAHKR
jgi:glycogen debranching enzyme